MSTTSRTKIGRADHGRRMAFAEYVDADFEEGGLYELARGVIDVTEVPGIRHGLIVQRIAQLFMMYDVAHPGVITYQSGGASCRIRLPGVESSRRPDQAVYLDPPPPGDQPWTEWCPHFAVEIISDGSDHRDYIEKAEEYLWAGVKEYWILDPHDHKFLLHTRMGDVWAHTIVPLGATYQTPLLPGLDVRPDDLFGSVN